MRWQTLPLTVWYVVFFISFCCLRFSLSSFSCFFSCLAPGGSPIAAGIEKKGDKNEKATHTEYVYFVCTCVRQLQITQWELGTMSAYVCAVWELAIFGARSRLRRRRHRSQRRLHRLG